MTGLVLAELGKLRTTRAVWGLLAAMLALVALGVPSGIADVPASELRRPLREQQLMLALTYVTRLFAVVLGVKAATDEFRYGTVVPALLTTPRRARVVSAKVVAVALTGLLFTELAGALAVALFFVLAPGESVEPVLTLADARAFAGLALAGGLWAAVGTGVGWAVRHQVAAVAGPVLWLLFVEDALRGRLGRLGDYLPGAAGSELAAFAAGRVGYVAAAVLAGWAALAWAAAVVATSGRDVP